MRQHVASHSERVGPLLNGEYLSPPFDKYKAGVFIELRTLSEERMVSVWLVMPDVRRLIQLVKGPAASTTVRI